MACDLPAELLARDVAWAIGWDRRRTLRFLQELGIATKRGTRWVVSGEALAAQLPEAADAWRRRGVATGRELPSFSEPERPPYARDSEKGPQGGDRPPATCPRLASRARAPDQDQDQETTTAPGHPGTSCRW